MTIASSVNRNNYTGNGTTEVYNYTFRIFSEEDLRVTVVDSDGVETLLTLTTDYTVSGAGEDSGGSITLVDANQDWLDAEGDLASGYSITIRRVRAILQETDIRNQGDFYPEVHEDAFDGFTMVDQQQQDELDRSIKLSETVNPEDFDTDIPAALVGTVNSVIMTNEDGDGFAVGPTADEVENAQSYAIAAAASEVAAEASEDAAAISETNAAASETAAAASAAAALVSENNASDSEDAAATSETNAAASEAAAAASAAAALTSENNAATSEDNAADSAADALASEVAAAASAAAAGLVVAGILTSPDTNDNTSGDITALSTASIGSVRLTNAGVTALSGIANGADGRMIFLNNSTGVSIPVGHLASGASASNRIWCPGGSPITWKPNTILFFKYDSTLSYWKVVGGAGDSGSGSGVETLMQKLEIERAGIVTERLDNSVGEAALFSPNQKAFSARLLESASAAATSIKLAWNPVYLNDSDKDLDASTNFTAVGEAASLSTSASSPKVGTNYVTYNKSGTAGLTGGIRYDKGSQTFNFGTNYRHYFWKYLPSTTGLTNVTVSVFADSTSNYRTWSLTTNAAGGALATGMNLMLVDLSTGGSATGSGWVYTQLARYVEYGVTMSSNAGTLTGLGVDAPMFSFGDVASLGLLGKQVTIYDTTNRENIILDSTNSQVDGTVTLAAGLANSYTGGSSASSAGVQRSTLTVSSGNIVFDSALSSGAISLTQTFRSSITERESLSQNLKSFVDVFTPQVYKVTSIPGGTSIAVEDNADTSLNLLSGDTIDIFETVMNDGQKFFIHRSTLTLSGNSSWSTPTLTIPVASSAGVTVGDYIAKRHHAVTVSCVGKTANESFASPTLSSTPNGIQLIDSGIYYPNAQYIWGHYALGGPSATEAVRQRKPGAPGPDFVIVGSPSTGDNFLRGYQSASGFTASNYIRTPAGSLLTLNGRAGKVQMSVWFYYDGTNVLDRVILDGSVTPSGWQTNINAGTSTVQFTHWANGSVQSDIILGSAIVGWNHLVIHIEENVGKDGWLNGARGTLASMGTIQTTGSQAMYIGARSNSGTVDANIIQVATNVKISQLLIQYLGPTLTDNQVAQLYNARTFQPVGFAPRVRSVYELNGQTGQKLSMATQLSRSTTAVSPAVLKMGTIKV